MAKIRKYRLSWEASDSKNVIGYKLYWSTGKEVSYDSEYIDLINLTEIILPDDVPFSDSPIMFGVAAIDRYGNESDITTIPDPYQSQVPKAPVGLSLTPLDEYKLIDPKKPDSNELQNVVNINQEQDENDDPLADAIQSQETAEWQE
jgi:hypothetical protein